MKMTLLEMVQDILTDMNSDNVNSISDTVESEQVASIVKNTYLKMCATREVPVLFANVELESVGTSDRPTVLRIPDNVAVLREVSYNDKPLKFLVPEDFTKLMRSRTETTDIVKVVDGVGVVLKVANNRDPEYYTTYDDIELFFDAYNAEEGATLVANYSLAYVELNPTFEMADEFIPRLPAHMFPYLLETAKSMSFVNVKQMANAAVEKGAMELKAYNSRTKRIGRYGIRTENYGRK